MILPFKISNIIKLAKNLQLTGLLLLGPNFLFGTTKISVSILPQKNIVEQVGKEKVTVLPLVKPQESEESCELTIEQRRQLDTTQLYFTIGLPFEEALIKNLNQKSPPTVKIVPIQTEIQLIALNPKAQCCHHHTSYDPHFWLDPLNMSIMAKIVEKSLSEIDPKSSTYYKKNLAKLESKLTILKNNLDHILASAKDKTMITVHPSYGYLAKTYGFSQIAIQENGKEPGAQHIKNLIDIMLEKNIHTIFTQPNFSPKTANALANTIQEKAPSHKINIIELNPLMENYIENMEILAKAIADGL